MLFLLSLYKKFLIDIARGDKTCQRFVAFTYNVESVIDYVHDGREIYIQGVIKHLLENLFANCEYCPNMEMSIKEDLDKRII